MTDFRPSATVIADSINPDGVRLSTLQVDLHLFMHRAFNTHRAFSRNSASNRAIPVMTTLRRMTETPVSPLVWPMERKGMQGGPPLPTERVGAARQVWDTARKHAMNAAQTLHEMGVHKSVVNRLLEPFQSVTIIVSATDWDDFFAQRLHPAGAEPLAQAEIVYAAEMMRKALNDSKPEPLDVGQYHLPYLSADELDTMPQDVAIRVSVARCARVSYLTHDGKRDIDADLLLYNRLVSADPPHWSPLEHVATPAISRHMEVRGNFTGWHQLRHTSFRPGVTT